MPAVDVLIVGGGPAGSSLGYMLQKSGLDCCIVDKAEFPRKKLCAGLLTQKTFNIIDEIFGDTTFPRELTTKNISLFLGTQRLSRVQADSEFYLVDRADFDFFFVKKYLAADGLLYENTKVKDVQLSAGCATLSSGERVNYKVLVGADGANSRVRKHVDEKYRPNALCLEFESPSPVVEEEIQVYFSAARSGYGWCFPKKNRCTVGVIEDIGVDKDIKTSFSTFFQSIGKTIGAENTAAALVPFGEYVKIPCRDNVLLVGDAAGFADSLTGEGVYFAFLSAKLASEAILGFILSKDDLAKSYLSKVKSIQEKIADGRRFKSLFFNKFTKTFLLNLINGKTNVVKYYYENMISHYNMTYFDFVKNYYKARQERKKSR